MSEDDIIKKMNDLMKQLKNIPENAKLSKVLFLKKELEKLNNLHKNIKKIDNAKANK